MKKILAILIFASCIVPAWMLWTEQDIDNGGFELYLECSDHVGIYNDKMYFYVKGYNNYPEPFEGFLIVYAYNFPMAKRSEPVALSLSPYQDFEHEFVIMSGYNQGDWVTNASLYTFPPHIPYAVSAVCVIKGDSL